MPVARRLTLATLLLFAPASACRSPAPIPPDPAPPAARDPGQEYRDGCAAMDSGRLEQARALLERVSDEERAAGRALEPRAIDSERRLAGIAASLGDLAGARQRLERLEALLAAALPAEHRELLMTRNNLGSLAQEAGDLVRARAWFEQVLATRERTLDEDSEDLIVSRTNLAALLVGQGEFAAARVLFERNADIQARSLPSNEAAWLRTRASLAGISLWEGDLPGARAVLEPVLAAQERRFPPDHPDLSTTRLNLGVVEAREGRFEAAESLLARQLGIEEGRRPPSPGRIELLRRNLAAVRFARGDLVGACALEERCLAELEQRLPAGHPDVQFARINLAATLDKLGETARARGMLEAAIGVLAAQRPADDPVLLTARLNLGVLLFESGDAERARTILADVLARRERLLPSDHADVREARLNLALAGLCLRDLLGARALLEINLEAETRLGGQDDLDRLRTIANLAQVLEFEGQHEPAREFAREVFAARERLLGPEHPDTLVAREALGLILLRGHETAQAVELLREGLELVERAALPSARAAVRLRRTLAAALVNLGRPQEAVGLLERDAREQPAAQRPPLEASMLHRNLATTYLLLDRKDEARAQMEALQSRFEQELEHASRMPPRQRMQAGQMLAEDSFVLVGLAERLEEPEAAHERTFRTLESLRALADLPPGTSDDLATAENRTLARRARQRIAQVAASGAPDAPSAIARLVRERDALEAALAESRAGSAPVTRAAVAAALPAGRAAVSYRVWVPTLRVPDGGSEVLLAQVVLPDGTLAQAKLGDAGEIAGLVVRWRAAIGAPIGAAEPAGILLASADPSRGRGALAGVRGEAEELGIELRRRIVDPVRELAPGVRFWHVCLDHELYHVPLDALPLGRGHLGEELQIVEQPSFRSLLEQRAPRPGADRVLLVGDVDYGSGAESAWKPLPGSAAEVAALAELASANGLREPLVLTGGAATPGALELGVRDARWLHLATHGFFAPLDLRTDVEAGALLAQQVLEALAPAVRAGIVLAGANLPADAAGSIESLLTAEELESWDLGGCELAVLSACDTGQGLVQDGQGLASLQAALHVAGARASICSLWKVPDEATKELMLDFYRRLWVEQKPTWQALWEAKLQLRDAVDERGRPRYTTRDWAAWVLTGDPD